MKGPVGIVAGSGIDLSPLLETPTRKRTFCEVPGLAPAGIGGHAGTFAEGRCGDTDVVVQCGRLHFYEGLDFGSVTQPVDVLRALGVRTILFTNAAGGLRPELCAGDITAITHIELWPCARWPGHPKRIEADIVLESITFEGSYVWVHGPCYETAAEIRALQTMDAAAVGMSTAPEVARCHQLGIRAAVISCVTNNCLTPQVLTHRHVLEIAGRSSQELCRVIKANLPLLAGAA